MNDVCTLGDHLLAVVGPDGAYRFVHERLCEWLEHEPTLLDVEGTFERDGYVWSVDYADLGGGESLRAVKRCHRVDTFQVSQAQILAAVVEASPVAILTLDLDMRVTMWNPACERVFGLTPEEVFGKPYPLVPADEWARFEVFFKTVISGQGFTGVETTRRRKDGSRVDVAISTAPIRSDDGVVLGAMAILEDITDRRRFERRLQETAKLEAIGRLAGGVAHDFNNVLTVVMAYAQELLSETEPKVDDINFAAEAILHSSDHARVLTQQLLAFSRSQVLRPAIIDLSVCVQTSLVLARRLLGPDIEVVTDFPADPCWIKADPVQIEQSIMNLTTNARDAMPDGGVMSVSTHHVRSSEGGRIELVVGDTGEGMDEETLERAFEPFFTTKSIGKGSGLGLASVYGTVHQSGGEVTIESELGLGTRFRLSFPESCPPIEPRSNPTPVEGLMAANDIRILVAEDEPAVRDVVLMMLTSFGYKADVAQDGVEALELLKAAPIEYELLITDVVMPRLGGGALAREARALQPELQVVFMSGFADDKVVHHYAAQGEYFLQKPFTAKQLRKMIASMFASRE